MTLHHRCTHVRTRGPHTRIKNTQNLIFRFLQSKVRVQVWLFEQTDMRIEGKIIVRRHAHARTHARAHDRFTHAQLSLPLFST